jgi:hypothetical protein
LSRVRESIRYVNLNQEMVNGMLDELLERIVEGNRSDEPCRCDCRFFRTVTRAAEQAPNGGIDLQNFVHNWPSSSQAGKRRRLSSASMTMPTRR